MTKTEACEKIRSHLDRCSNHSISITHRIAWYWWEVCNVAIFNNKLYRPSELLIKEMKDWGYCSVSSSEELTIALNSEKTTRSMFLATLIHEMIHQWEYQTYGRMGHGKRFLKWKERVSKLVSLDIHVDANEEDYTYGEKQLYQRRY